MTAPDPTGLRTTALGTEEPPPAGWTPIGFAWRDGAPVVDWCHTEGVRFDDPFFAETVERCLRHPFRLLFRRRTGIAALAAAAELRPGLPPSGFVFHLSRCGSTLVTRMLAARADTHVMSEPGPLEPVLAATSVPDAVRVDWVRWLIAALGQPAEAEQRHYVVKLDAWAALDLPLLARAFPDVPFVFLYRDPLEVLVSQSGHRGYHMVPFALAPQRVGLDPAQVAAMSPHEYGAAVLGRIVEAALAFADEDRLLLVDYRELPDAVATRIAPHFGIPVRSGDVDVMRTVVATHAKNPVLPYVDDVARKRAAASDDMREAVARWATPSYTELRRRRAALERTR
jgi:hypothetical protein